MSWVDEHAARHPGLQWRLLRRDELGESLPTAVVQVASEQSEVWRDAFDAVAGAMRQSSLWLLLIDAAETAPDVPAVFGPDGVEIADTVLFDCGRIRARARRGALGQLLHQLRPMMDDGSFRVEDLRARINGLRAAFGGLSIRHLQLASGEWPDGVTVVHAAWSTPSMAVVREVASLATEAGVPLHVIDDEAQGPELIRRRFGWFPGGWGETVVVEGGQVVAKGDGRAFGPVRRLLRSRSA